MKEKILEAFKTLGFKLEEIEEMGYTFCYEDIHMLWSYNEADEDFFSLSVPAMYDCGNDKLPQSCALMFKINSTLKYVKAYNIDTNLWLFYERELFGNEALDELIARMVLHLEAAVRFTRKAIEEIENIDTDDDIEDDDCCVDDTSEDDDNEEFTTAEEVVDDNENNK